MFKRVAGAMFWASLICAACFGQTSFQGLTPGTSTRGEVERVFGQPLGAAHVTPVTSGEYLLEYKPPAGIAKVEVGYKAASSAVDRIRVHFLKPISRAALLRKFNLPQQADAKRLDADGKLVEYFGGQALLVMTYAASDADSGVSRVAYCSRELFDIAVKSARPPGRTSAASVSSVTGRWSGPWTNSKGESGESSINLVEQGDGTITGDERGWEIVNGRRNENVLTWEYHGRNNGCRDYSVRWEISGDGRTANGTYKVTDRCAKQTYTGNYMNYHR